MPPLANVENNPNALPVSRACAGPAMPPIIAEMMPMLNTVRCDFVVKKKSAFHGAGLGPLSALDEEAFFAVFSSAVGFSISVSSRDGRSDLLERLQGSRGMR